MAAPCARWSPRPRRACATTRCAGCRPTVSATASRRGRRAPSWPRPSTRAGSCTTAGRERSSAWTTTCAFLAATRCSRSASSSWPPKPTSRPWPSSRTARSGRTRCGARASRGSRAPVAAARPPPTPGWRARTTVRSRRSRRPPTRGPILRGARRPPPPLGAAVLRLHAQAARTEDQAVSLRRRPRDTRGLRWRDGHAPPLHGAQRADRGRHRLGRVRAAGARLRRRPDVRADHAPGGRRGGARGRLHRRRLHAEGDHDRRRRRRGRQGDGLRPPGQSQARPRRLPPAVRRDLQPVHARGLPDPLRAGLAALHLPLPRRHLRLPGHRDRRPACTPARPLPHPREGRHRRGRATLLGDRRARRDVRAPRPVQPPQRPLEVPLPAATDDMRLPSPPLPKALRRTPPRPGARPSRDGTRPNGAVQDLRPGARDGRPPSKGGSQIDRQRLKEQATEVPVSVAGWLDERSGASPFVRGFMYRKVPRGTNWFYTLGSATMFAFLAQAVTGVFLAMYYNPAPGRLRV